MVTGPTIISRIGRDVVGSVEPTGVDGLLASDGRWLCQQPRHPHEVVRASHQVARQLRASQSAVVRPTEAADETVRNNSEGVRLGVRRDADPT